ncbi:MAG TPA: hypothetical protein P5560_12810 [Thermotogota bacterium]|nr:hypothetical protein [Thermotogota bacterium]HRW93825.1 hypothetical protein [Thermotogota bacterium]
MNELKVRVTQDALDATNLYKLNVLREIRRLKTRIQAGEWHKLGIQKVKNVPGTLFRIHLKDKFRLFFQMDQDTLEIVLIDRRDETLYERVVRKRNGLFAREFLQMDMESLLEEEQAEPFEWEKQDGNGSPIHYERKVFEIPEKYFQSEIRLQDFFENDFQFHPKTTMQQEKLYTDIVHSNKADSWTFKGGAGSGKTTCAFGVAERFFRDIGTGTFLLFPTEKLVDWGNSFFSKRALGDFVHVMRRGSGFFPSEKHFAKKRIYLATYEDFLASFLNGEAKQLDTQSIIQRIDQEIKDPKKAKQYQGFPSFTAREIYFLLVNYILPEEKLSDRDLLSRQARDLHELIVHSPLPGKYKREFKRDALDHHDLIMLFTQRMESVVKKFPLSGFNMVLDEAQDLSLQWIHGLVDFFHRTQRKTQPFPKIVFLSDPNQKITVNNFREGALRNGILPKEFTTQAETLKYNFRFSPQICRFSEKLITEFFPEYVKSDQTSWPFTQASEKILSSPGAQPLLVVYPEKKVLHLIREIVQQNLSQFQGMTRFVLVADLNRVDTSLLDDPSFPVSFFSPEQVKGLEFTSVIVLNVFPKPENKRLVDVTKLYTSVTRARQSVLVCVEEHLFSPFQERFENSPDVHVLINPEREILVDFLLENGKNILTHDQFIKALQNKMATLKKGEDNKIQGFFEQIQFIEEKEESEDAVRRLVVSLYQSMIRVGIPFSQVEGFFSCQSRMVHGFFWEAAGKIRKAVEAFQSEKALYPLSLACIDRSLDNPEVSRLECFRACVVSDYDEQLKRFRKKWKSPAHHFEHMVSLARQDNEMENQVFWQNIVEHALVPPSKSIAPVKRVLEEATKLFEGGLRKNGRAA